MTSPGRVPIFDGHNDVLFRLFRRGGTDAPRAFSGEGKGQLEFPMACQGAFAGGLFAMIAPSTNGAIAPNGEAPSQNVGNGNLENSGSNLPTLSDERIVHLNPFGREVFAKLTIS